MAAIEVHASGDVFPLPRVSRHPLNGAQVVVYLSTQSLSLITRLIECTQIGNVSARSSTVHYALLSVALMFKARL